MTKIEKLKLELSGCQSTIKKLKEKETLLEEKILLEEQKEIQKLMKDRHITFEELTALLES